MKIFRWCRIDKDGCVHCQGRTFKHSRVITDELAKTWELNQSERNWFDDREGNFCQNCRMSKRVRMLLWSARRLYPDLQPLHILHLNQINGLTPPLSIATQLVETTYIPSSPLGANVGGLSNQDLTRLTFDDDLFDLVIHAETLEHLHNYEQALNEGRRVLKVGGYQVYSIPLLHGRATRRRITLDENGHTIDLLPPSYHGLSGEYSVVWEFGGDFIERRQDRIHQIHYDNFWRNKTIFAIVERR